MPGKRVFRDEMMSSIFVGGGFPSSRRPKEFKTISDPVLSGGGATPRGQHQFLVPLTTIQTRILNTFNQFNHELRRAKIISGKT